MSNQNEEHNMGSTVWQTQALEAPRISLEYVRHQAEKLNADFRKESYLIYTNLALAVLLMFWILLKPPPAISDSYAWVIRLGSLLLVAGVTYFVFQFRRRVSKLTVHEEQKVTQSLEAYRIELQRRRKLNSWLGGGALWPMIPAILVFFAGGIMYDQRSAPAAKIRALVVLGVVILISCWHYRRKGRKFQRELDALATMDNK